MTFGRTLVDGTPTDGGVSLLAAGPTMDALAETTDPLISNPQLGEDGVALVTAAETDGEYMQAMVMAEAMGDDTVFTSPPPVLQSVLATVFGPVGRALGYRASYPRYNQEEFWTTRVEQRSVH